MSIFVPRTSPSPAALDQFQAQIEGPVITPGDEHYDAARMAFNLTIDQYPAVVVFAENAEDVAASVQFAARENLGLAIQSTGHGVVLPADNSLLLVTSHLQTLIVNADEQTAVLGAGLRWGSVLEQTQEYGLAPLLGSSPGVGVVGYTLGGGMGWLARKYGLAADSVIYFDLVTADGQMIRASADENSDLFWALRGGGGGFGVVTAMKIRLYPVTEVYGGNLYYPVEDARAVFHRYRDWIANAPDELTSSIVIMNFPPLPVLPEILRGKSYAMVRGCYAGDIAEGEALLKFWRDWKTPVIDDFKAMPFSTVARISNDPTDPVPGSTTGAWLHELSDTVLDTLAETVPATNGPTPIVVAEIRHAGGAIARVDGQASAYGNRQAPHILQFIGMTPTLEAKAEFKARTAQIKRTIQPALTGGVYPNFLDGDEARERTADAYTAENYQRLQEVKGQRDAANRFRHSFDIKPVP